MKLLNIFKKEPSKLAKNKIQKMDKKQLEKVIGGGDKERIVVINTTHVE